MKKFISLLLAIMMLLSVTAGFSFTAEAATNISIDGSFVNGSVSDTVSYYKFTLPSDGKVDIKVIRFTRVLFYLTNRTYETVTDLGSNDGGYWTAGKPDAPNTSNYQVILSKGTYYIQVKKAYDYTGDYSFNVKFTSYNTNETEPNTLASPMSITNGSSVSACFTEQDNMDWYTFTLSKKSKVTVTAIRYNTCLISVCNSTFEEITDLYNKDGGYWSKGTEDAPKTTTAEIELSAGKYYIKAEKKTNGKYIIKLNYSTVTPQKNGWVTENGKTYYYKDGTMLKYRQTIAGKLYYFNSKGEMVKGWLTISGKKYYFGKDGAAVKYRQTIGGKHYYFNSKGEMVKGWLTISGRKYYFGSDGAAVRYTQYISGKRYYFNGNYQMMTGWLKIKDRWFYFTGSGAAATGWWKIGGKWYYFNDSGTMRTAALKYKGKTYYFYSSGACKNP